MIKEKIEKDCLDAYKARDEFKTSVLRMVKTAIKNAEINNRHDATDEEVVTLLKKEIKQRKDTALLYNSSGKSEAALGEEREISLLSTYLPQQLDESKSRELVIATIKELGAGNPSDAGNVIGKIMKEYGSSVDGSEIAKIVREELQVR